MGLFKLLFGGSSSEEQMYEVRIKANYPGAKPQQSYRNFGVEAKPAKNR